MDSPPNQNTHNLERANLRSSNFSADLRPCVVCAQVAMVFLAHKKATGKPVSHYHIALITCKICGVLFMLFLQYMAFAGIMDQAVLMSELSWSKFTGGAESTPHNFFVICEYATVQCLSLFCCTLFPRRS